MRIPVKSFRFIDALSEEPIKDIELIITSRYMCPRVIPKCNQENQIVYVTDSEGKLSANGMDQNDSFILSETWNKLFDNLLNLFLYGERGFVKLRFIDDRYKIILQNEFFENGKIPQFNPLVIPWGINYKLILIKVTREDLAVADINTAKEIARINLLKDTRFKSCYSNDDLEHISDGNIDIKQGKWLVDYHVNRFCEDQTKCQTYQKCSYQVRIDSITGDVEEVREIENN